MNLAQNVRPTELERFDLIRQSHYVQRYHTQRIRPQSVGEHSAGVLEIVLAIRPSASPALVALALRHDVYEIVTGDVPAPAKWYSKELARELRHVEAALDDKYKAMPDDDMLLFDDHMLVAWADSVELVMYCAEQALSGNAYAREVMDRGWAAAEHKAINLGVADAHTPGYGIITTYTRNLIARVNNGD